MKTEADLGTATKTFNSGQIKEEIWYSGISSYGSYHDTTGSKVKENQFL